MSLSQGTRLGPYEILAVIGAGGMGEVYRARDTRLGRIVAVKVAHERFSERFEREARVVASLNHPYICTLYDVGPNYLVMEYIEGQPLRGPLPPELAVEYAAQICDALDAAHRKGVVHRDLKPGNILVTRTGVKLLDFGLARIEGGPDGDTRDPAVTQTGAVMGTPAYMAPEQWEGKPGDLRSDIYAFGCVLYEMLTGKRAAQERAAVESASIESVIRGCLERDPDERWQSARDARRALRMPSPPARQMPHRRRERILWIAALTVALAVAVASALRRPTDSLRRFPLYPPEKTTYAGPKYTTVTVPQLALSPDGSAIAFIAASPGGKRMLWVKFDHEVAARQLPGTEDAETPFWSPDNRTIAFFAQGEIRAVAAAGGTTPRKLGGAPDPRGGSWGANDTILFGTGTEGLYRVDSSGVATPVTKLDTAFQEGSHRWPAFLPDGKHFVYTIRGAKSEHVGIFVGSIDGTMKTMLVPSTLGSGALYASGYLLFMQGSTLMARSFDTSSFTMSGPSMTVTDRAWVGSSNYLSASVSKSGTLAFGSDLLVSLGQLIWFDPKGNALGTVGQEAAYTDFRLSHDNKRLAASRVDTQTGNVDLYITDLTQQNPTQRFTTGPLLNAAAVWSKNDEEIAFRTTRTGGFVEIYKKSSAGGGTEAIVLLKDKQLAAGGSSLNLSLTDWSWDGTFLLYSGLTSNGAELWRLPLVADQKPERLLNPKSQLMHGNLSPSGHLVAYTSNQGEGGAYNVWVETIPGSVKKRQVSLRTGYEPRFRADGRMLYYLSGDRKLMAVTVDETNFTFGSPQELFPTQVPDGLHPYLMHYVPNRDGSQFLVNTQVGEPLPTPIIMIWNWTQLLKK